MDGVNAEIAGANFCHRLTFEWHYSSRLVKLPVACMDAGKGREQDAEALVVGS